MAHPSHIGMNIRRECSNQNITLDELSRRTGLSVGRLYEIEEAGGCPRLSEIIGVSRALDVPYTALLVSTARAGNTSGRSIVSGSLRLHRQPHGMKHASSR